MSNADLIAKARKFAVYYDGGGPKGILGQVLDALEIAERELAAERATIAEVDEYLDAIQKPDYESLNFALNGIAKTLAQSPADVLKAVREEAWDEGYTVGNAHNGRRDANPHRDAPDYKRITDTSDDIRRSVLRANIDRIQERLKP